MKKLTIYLFLTLTMVLSASAVYAQGRGNLRGVVKDKAGSVLPGAAVMINGTTIGAATDLEGNFIIQGAPAKEVEVKINYLGYETLLAKVTIAANSTTTQNFVLEETSHTLNTVVITAFVEGQQRALNQQKNADNLTQIVSADQMGRFPDPNVADALKRLSGVTTNGTEVQMRGTPASFTNINVNGEQVMSSQEGGKRNESLDVIPSDILASLEVQKTLLPSNDGDAISGAINMRTATALSLTPKYSIDLGTGYNGLREKMILSSKLGFSKRFFPSDKNTNGVLGFTANYSFLRDNLGYDRIEGEAWEQAKLTDFTTNNVISDKNYIPTDFRYRHQSRESTRQGLSVTVDFAPNPNTKFVLSTLYNNRSNEDVRYRNRYRFRDNGKGFFLMPDGTIGSQRMRNISQVSTQKEDIYNININLDGESTIGTWKIDGGLFYNKTRRDYESSMAGFQNTEWRSGRKVDGVTLPATGVVGTMPSITSKYLETSYIDPLPGMNPESGDHISRFSYYIMENNHMITKGDNFTGRFNVSKNYLLGDYASVFSFGAKGKFMKNSGYVPEGTNTYSINSSTNNKLNNLLHTEQLTTKFMDNKLAFGAAPDMGKIQNYMNNPSNSGDILLNQYFTNMNRDAFFYEASEDVLATYFMNKIQIDNLMILGGARVEMSSVDYKANIISPFVDINEPIQGGDPTLYNNYTLTPVNRSVNYVQVLPNIQFKLDATERTVIRMAWTTGYSRPNIMDLVPKQGVQQEYQRVTIGNPDLKPAFANNIDFLVEQYLPNVGLISGGLFTKNIDQFQYLSEGKVNTPGELYDGWTLIQTKNGDAANVYGAEFTINSNLTFLPSILKNLVFTSNYTYVHSNATTAATSDNNRGSTRLPGQASHVGNLALAYSTKAFTLQASANYNGEYIMALGADEDRDIWQAGRWQMDLNASLKIIKGLTFWGEVVNILNSEYYTYFGNKDRVYQLQFNGVNGRCGFTYRF